MKHLLVASDLSHRSEMAIAQAFFLARRFNASLTVLHIVDDELPAAVFNATRSQAERNLRATVEGMVGAETMRISVRVVGGLYFQSILDVTEEEDASLIILGAHRRKLLKNVLTGTTVERVIRNASTPVLVVKRPTCGGYVCTLAAVELVEEAASVFRYAHLMADGQSLYAIHVLNDLVTLQMKVAGCGTAAVDYHQARIHQRCESALRGVAQRAKVPLEGWLPVVHWGSDPASEILMAAEMFGAELGVVGTRTRDKGLIERGLFGSIAERLLLDMTCDVLAVPLTGATPLSEAAGIATLE